MQIVHIAFGKLYFEIISGIRGKPRPINDVHGIENVR